MSAKEQVIEFVRGLSDDLPAADIAAVVGAEFGAPDVPGERVSEEVAEAAWAAVINRRVEELRSGKVKGVPAERMFPELNEPAE